MSTQMKQSDEQLIFRKTNAHKGRTTSITPENSAMKHLVYGRIILDEGTPSADFNTGELETGLICLSGDFPSLRGFRLQIRVALLAEDHT